jgi:hypothetical protein
MILPLKMLLYSDSKRQRDSKRRSEVNFPDPASMLSLGAEKMAE